MYQCVYHIDHVHIMFDFKISFIISSIIQIIFTTNHNQTIKSVDLIKFSLLLLKCVLKENHYKFETIQRMFETYF